MSAVLEVWRIAPDSPDSGADDVSGRGAEKTGGRWNRKGTPMLYCSSTVALASLEMLVHQAAAAPLPLNRFLVRIAVPRSAWRARTVLKPGEHIGWESEPAGSVSIGWGNDWASCAGTLIAEVPSVIVPEEANVLINPRHRDAKRLRVRKVRRWTYDPRLARARHQAH